MAPSGRLWGYEKKLGGGARCEISLAKAALAVANRDRAACRQSRPSTNFPAPATHASHLRRQSLRLPRLAHVAQELERCACLVPQMWSRWVCCCRNCWLIWSAAAPSIPKPPRALKG